MTTNIPALQLEASWFDKIHVAKNDSYVEEKDDARFAIRTHVNVYQNNEDQAKFLVNLDVSPDEVGEKVPYDFSLSAAGIFKVSDEYLEQGPGLVHITGSSILYNSCREMLLILTGRMSRRSIKLPTVSPREQFLPEPEGESDSSQSE